MSDVKSLFRKKTKSATKAKAEPAKPTVTAQQEEDDEWGVVEKPVEQLYTGNRQAAELIGSAFKDENIAAKVAHDDTKLAFHEIRKKASSSAAAGPSAANPATEAKAEPTPPAAAPAPAAPGAKWRSARMMQQQGIGASTGSASSSSLSSSSASAYQRPFREKVEDFPALGGLAAAAMPGPKPVDPTTVKAKAGSAWARIGGQQQEQVAAAPAAKEEESVKKEEEPAAAKPTEAAAPAPAPAPVPVAKPTEAEAAAPVPAPAEAAEAPKAAPASAGAATGAAAKEAGPEEEEAKPVVAVSDLKSKFGSKKKKKPVVPLDK